MTSPQAVTSLAELDALIERSHERPVFLFKHSLTCPVSGAAWSRYLEFMASESPADRVDFAKIEIQNARDISNAVAERTGVRHESPQALLFVDGDVVWNTSHLAITEKSLESALAAVLD